MGKHPDCTTDTCVDGHVECWSPGGPCPRPNEPGCELCGPCNECTAADVAPPRELREPIVAGQTALRIGGSCRMCGRDEGDDVGVIIDSVCGECRRAWA